MFTFLPKKQSRANIRKRMLVLLINARVVSISGLQMISSLQRNDFAFIYRHLYDLFGTWANKYSLVEDAYWPKEQTRTSKSKWEFFIHNCDVSNSIMNEKCSLDLACLFGPLVNTWLKRYSHHDPLFVFAFLGNTRHAVVEINY